MANDDRHLWWINGTLNNLSLFYLIAINTFSGAVLAVYLTNTYLWPYVKRRWTTYQTLRRKKVFLSPTEELTSYEEEIALGAVAPDEIENSFTDIGGLEEEMSMLRRNVALVLGNSITSTSNPRQMQSPSMFSNTKLFRAPTGILLHGPPGCGKTMLVKALAKETDVRFINVNLATIMDKWVGETEKYVDAIFSLAKKIKPCIVFVDEIDSLTRRRSPFDRDWTSSMKAQFLTLWDGLLSDPDGQVIVMGATNRRDDIDEAFLRRMPLQLFVPMPDQGARESILRKMLQGIPVDDKFNYDRLAEECQGYSGSDLRELCRRVVVEAQLESKSELSIHDFEEALGSMSPTPEQGHFAAFFG